MTKKKLGIVLTGGGARGAYQSGAISALLEIAEDLKMDWPFEIVCGTSAGALNAAFLVSQAYRSNYRAIGRFLNTLWGGLRSHDIYRTGPMAMASNGLSWLKFLGTGGLVRHSSEGLSLLDTAPLRKFLRNKVDFTNLERGFETGKVTGWAITAVCYNTGMARTFFRSEDPVVHEWKRTKREGVRASITIDHILASAAIPLLFPPVSVSGNYYGDGSLRDYAPISPAIKLGAEKVLVIGVRKRMREDPDVSHPPSPAKVISAILNGILLDALDLDHERLERINRTLTQLKDKQTSELRPISVKIVAPSQFLDEIAAKELHHLPNAVKYMVKGLGNTSETSDLTSYILFEPAFTQKLIDIGRQDIFNMRDEIISFLQE